MNRPIRPAGVAGPAANYELAVATRAGSEMVHTAGIVGAAPDGTVPDPIGEQAEHIWRTIDAILRAAAFDRSHIVQYTTYVVAGQDLAAVMAARDAYLGSHTAASVLVTVPALAQPAWKVEVAVIAARPS